MKICCQINAILQAESLSYYDNENEVNVKM